MGRPVSFHDRNTPNAFRAKLERGQLVVTGEVSPPHGVDCSAMIEGVDIWAPHCDAINITDNQGASLHLSSLAASRMTLNRGSEPIFQQTCRDRNRLALQSDLLAAWTLGLENFLAVTGDSPLRSRYAGTRAVYDLDSTQLLTIASGLNKGVDMCGIDIGQPTDFYLGAAAFLDVEPFDIQRRRIEQKIAAGARFFQTQAIMDIEKVIPRIKAVQDAGGKVIAGVLLLKSLGVVNFINDRLEGLHVPGFLSSRIAQAADPLAEAIELATEQVQILKEVADGIHIMPLGNHQAGVEVLLRAGLE